MSFMKDHKNTNNLALMASKVRELVKKFETDCYNYEEIRQDE